MQKSYINNRFIVFVIKCIIYPLVFMKGIKVEGGDKLDETGIVVAAPHTSNWDFVFGFYCGLKHNVKAGFLIKDSWCKGPFGKIVRYFGGIPVNRGQSHNMVGSIAETLNNNQGAPLVIAITPEGTRKKVNSWKEGFYHIAQQANCPIYMATLDHSTKRFKIWDKFFPTDNKEDDFQKLFDIASSVKGKHPDNQYPPYKKQD